MRLPRLPIIGVMRAGMVIGTSKSICPKSAAAATKHAGSSNTKRCCISFGLANEDELVLLLNENAAILRPLALPELMQGRDWLLTCIESDLPQLDMQIWRKTEHVMRELFEIVTRCRNGVVLPKEEALLLQAFAYCPSRYRVGDVMAVVPASTNVESVWAHWSAFSVKICDQKHHRRFRNALLEHINDCQTRGLPLLSLNDTGITDTSAVSIRQPNRSVAIVTLYTPNKRAINIISTPNFPRAPTSTQRR
ncbi:hypothetical protein [Caballeronia sp. GACF4]|uniref:hypothetical protein n=1 Tax=Caballeronia sp. GACF4 TaxID=2921763 RepID=UPI00202817A9|nr:hypothetical protein [Caballeronia sp. GACF4]